VALENKQLFSSILAQERLKKEYELASQIQTMLVPEKLPDNAYMEMAAEYIPHHDIGGDYYDVIEVDENEIFFCIGDISGKGAAAALLMANFQANLRALVKQYYSLEEMIRILNKRVCEITKGDKFITIFLANYNYKTRTMNYINAGHNQPVIYNGKEITLLDKGCTLLGIFDELPSVVKGVEKIDANSIVVNYTDGLTELENEQGVFFEQERLIDFIKKNHQLKIKKFNIKLLQEINTFKGTKQFSDDITLLSCRIF